MGIRQSILLRVRIAFLLISLFAVTIIGRVLYIQIIDGEKWTKRAQANGLRYRVVKANRGNILAADGSLLATSIPFYRLAIDPTIAEELVFNNGIDSLSMLLAQHFKGRSAKEIKAEIESARAEKRRFKLLLDQPINYQQKNMVATWPILREGKNKGGIIFEKIQTRFRPYADLARRTLGFIKEDTGAVKGRGLEFSFQGKLAGYNGQALFQRIAGNDWKPVGDGSSMRPTDGMDILTTIDVHLQEVADRALRNALIQNDADYGCVILMEVETGEIKAVVNLGKDGQGSYSENNNYAVGNAGLAEPGSTFKMMTMAALFEEVPDLKLSDTLQAGNGTYRFFENAVMTDVKEGGYGKITVQEAFENSSNIGISKLVYKYFRKTPEKFVEYIGKFGLNQPIDFQMEGEATPMIKKPGDASWSGATLPWMSVGYEMKMSPLHTLTFCNALANKGRMMQPFIVKQALYANKVVEEYRPRILVDKVCSDKTLATLRTLMEGVVLRGTAKNIKTEEYSIAGKTGTAEKVEKGVYTEKHYTSFVGYFPSNEPKYSCIVVIDNPKAGSQFGAVVSAPVFKQIADFAYRSYLMEPLELVQANRVKPPMVRAGNQKDLKKICEELGFVTESFTPDDWVSARVNGDTIRWKSNQSEIDVVPNVVGMSLRDALYILENRGVRVNFFGRGKITHQSIPPGSKVAKNRKIVLTLG